MSLFDVLNANDAALLRAALVADPRPDVDQLFGPRGMTTLGYAVERGNLPAVNVLLEFGARMDIGPEGFTPVHCASMRTEPDILNALLRAGASPNARTDRGDTPLMWAAGRARVGCVIALIANGARIEDVGQYNRTALVYTTISYSDEDTTKAMILVLVNAGASLDTRDSLGHTAMSSFISSNPSRVDAAVLLASLGADPEGILNMPTKVVDACRSRLAALKPAAVEAMRLLGSPTADAPREVARLLSAEAAAEAAQRLEREAVGRLGVSLGGLISVSHELAARRNGSPVEWGCPQMCFILNVGRLETLRGVALEAETELRAAEDAMCAARARQQWIVDERL